MKTQSLLLQIENVHSQTKFKQANFTSFGIDKKTILEKLKMFFTINLDIEFVTLNIFEFGGLDNTFLVLSTDELFLVWDKDGKVLGKYLRKPLGRYVLEDNDNLVFKAELFLKIKNTLY